MRASCHTSSTGRQTNTMTNTSTKTKTKTNAEKDKDTQANCLTSSTGKPLPSSMRRSREWRSGPLLNRVPLETLSRTLEVRTEPDSRTPKQRIQRLESRVVAKTSLVDIL